eukprot:TRINITY_DN3498_c0_g1_i1.p1 TRINITY_DN3498_c0_g1~~TRINITY_DN3498_c0_g1_i1.p1  ORF type:complete len:897 (+),score=72.16 TRINITY_DN3498_c0_g1_i1:286-2976(+)
MDRFRRAMRTCSPTSPLPLPLTFRPAPLPNAEQSRRIVAIVSLALASVVLSSVVYTQRDHLHAAVSSLLEFLTTLPRPVALFAVGILVIILSFPPFQGYSLLLLSSGYLFGWSTILVSYPAALVGSSTAFTVFRRFSPSPHLLVSWFPPALRRANGAVARGGFRLILVVRLAPIPFSFGNLLFATLVPSVSLRLFSAATAVSCLKQVPYIAAGVAAAGLEAAARESSAAAVHVGDGGSVPSEAAIRSFVHRSKMVTMSIAAEPCVEPGHSLCSARLPAATMPWMPEPEEKPSPAEPSVSVVRILRRLVPPPAAGARPRSFAQVFACVNRNPAGRRALPVRPEPADSRADEAEAASAEPPLASLSATDREPTTDREVVAQPNTPDTTARLVGRGRHRPRISAASESTVSPEGARPWAGLLSSPRHASAALQRHVPDATAAWTPRSPPGPAGSIDAPPSTSRPLRGDIPRPVRSTWIPLAYEDSPGRVPAKPTQDTANVGVGVVVVAPPAVAAGLRGPPCPPEVMKLAARAEGTGDTSVTRFNLSHVAAQEVGSAAAYMLPGVMPSVPEVRDGYALLDGLSLRYAVPTDTRSPGDGMGFFARAAAHPELVASVVLWIVGGIAAIVAAVWMRRLLAGIAAEEAAACGEGVVELSLGSPVVPPVDDVLTSRFERSSSGRPADEVTETTEPPADVGVCASPAHGLVRSAADSSCAAGGTAPGHASSNLGSAATHRTKTSLADPFNDVVGDDENRRRPPLGLWDGGSAGASSPRPSCATESADWRDLRASSNWTGRAPPACGPTGTHAFPISSGNAGLPPLYSALSRPLPLPRAFSMASIRGLVNPHRDRDRETASGEHAPRFAGPSGVSGWRGGSGRGPIVTPRAVSVRAARHEPVTDGSV